MSVIPVLSTKEVLLEHLYAVITPLVPGYGDKIVGMLMDTTELQLMAILGNQQLLNKTVTDALQAIKKSEVSLGSHSSDTETIGEQLYHKVADVEPELCAQITGMLLEMDLTTVSHLLTDDTALSAAITRAKQELITGSHHHQQHHKLPQQIAETLYEAVSEIYEKNTPKITGMLTDISPDHLTWLLRSPSQFKQTVELCRAALEDTNQWIPELS